MKRFVEWPMAMSSFQKKMVTRFRMTHLFNKTNALIGLTMIVLGLIFSASASANDTTLTAQRPREEAFRQELKKDLSSLNITIETTEKDLSSNLNRIIPKELYKGGTATKGLNAVILKNGPITVSAADNYLYLTIPITISLSYGMFEIPTIANKLKFKLDPKVTPDWKVNAEVYYLGLSDLIAEDVGAGPFSIKTRSIVEGVTQPLQRILSDLINKKLNEQFPLKIQAAKVWDSAQKPILLDKSYSAWLKITPQDMLLYPFYAQKGMAKLTVGLKSFAELAVGPEPATRAPVPLPNLKLVNGAGRTFRIALNTDIFFKDLLSIALPLLLNKELGSDGKSIILKDLDLYGNGDRLIIKVAATGTLDGIFFLNCRPVFNPQTNVFSVEDVDFDMQTKDLLLRSADWFLHGTIRSSIQERLNMDLTQRLTQARELANKAMTRVKLAENIVLTGNVKTMKLSDVMVQKDKISIQVSAEGETAIAFH